MKSIFLALFFFLASVSTSFAEQGTALQTNENGDVITTFATPSFANLSRLYWVLNVYSTDNDELIDNFLLATECDLFQRFFTNEFEWRKIRQATRTYLDKYKSGFPTNFEYVQPMSLDRYNFDLKGFPISAGSAYSQTTRLEIYGSSNGGGKCGNINLSHLNGYPQGVVLNIKQPFKLGFIRVSEDLAKEYLKMLEEKNIDQNAGRPAYIRFRIRFDRYIGETFNGSDKFGEFGGSIESIEVFADRDMMFKLYEQTLY